MNPLSNKQPSGNVSFTEEQARHIKYKLCTPRGMGGEGRSVAEAAQIYGVCRETIRRILRGETWGWLQPGPHQNPEFSEEVQAKTEQSVARLRAMLGGESMSKPVSDEPVHKVDAFDRAHALLSGMKKTQEPSGEEKLDKGTLNE